MKKYNEKLIAASTKIAHDSLNKSMNMAKTLTNPSNKIAKVGGRIGSIIGIVFIITGIVKLSLGDGIWAIASLITGIVTVISNLLWSRR